MRTPTIMIPYSPDPSTECQDIFVYLRPETNGVKAESTILKAIKSNPLFERHIELVYLANFPGDFIVENRIIEKHYRVKMHFAANGSSAFTEYMKKQFSSYFSVDFSNARILGAFEALQELRLSPEQLFELWVDEKDLLVLNGQNIKRYKDSFIVNYEIPAVLHKNNFSTDIAVMVFRSSLEIEDFHALFHKIYLNLVEDGSVSYSKPIGRIFHYSKSPFEQVLDALGFLYTEEGSIPLEEIQFSRFLINSGWAPEIVTGALENPIMGFHAKNGDAYEDNILYCTIDDSFEEACGRLEEAEYQVMIV